MSLKDLFGKTSEKIVANKQLQDIYKEIESEGLVEEIVTDRDRFLPAVDFSSASNFARYGSAERYYVDAITNIYENYPYDGSKKEKLEWRNKSSQLDLYIFDSIYPKTTGYVNLGSGSAGSYVTGSNTYRYSVYPQYVSLKGGPNASQTGKFEDSNLYDLSLNRESNLGITSLGNTVEFWFKDNVSTSSAATNYVFCLFDMWNQVVSGSSDYTRLTIEHSSSNKFLLTYVSGTKGLVRQEITFTGSLSDWHHYAFSFKNNDINVANLDVSFYVDGNLYSTQTFTNRGNINLANNRNLKANIGAYLANHSGSNTAVWEGLGNSFGSYDEFRFWKASRTSKEIYRNWFTQTGGGANTDDSNVNLGVYYKFNEGIVSTNSINSLDAICLDSSGRVTNGTINNYALNVRNTSSAIDVYFGETLEEKDPIIFSSNPAVSEIVDYYTEVGADYDKDNNSNILYSLPSWILDESGTDKNDLTSLIQIIASYFDTVHNQINELPKIKNIEYTQQGNKPKPFTNKLLTSAGFQNIEIFNDINFLEEILSRNEGEIFEDKLHNIKNVIYQNIYNNLAYIYKTKGTEKSLRNLIRCFGVDDELVKINLYANNAEYELSDKYNYSSVAKKFLDLNDADRYDGFVVQKKISGDNDTSGYIVGNTSFYYVPLTAQAEVIFPKKVPYDNPNYDVPDFSEVSIFGAHTAQADENNLTWTNNPDLFNFDVYVVKPSSESNDGYFKLVTTIGGVTSSLTTSYYNELYENEKWNLAVRLYPNKYGFSDTVGGTTTTDYTLEFIGYNSLLDNVQNEFKLSLNVSESFGKLAMQANKRFYAGALYTDFSTGSSQIARSDVKISSVRVWMDYLSDTELKIHSYDAGNVGRQFPNWDPKTIFGEDYIATKIDTLALNWDFFNVTSSDENGQFIVQDVSSGSYELATNSAYGSFGLAAKIRHTGFGDNFYPDDNQVVNKEYIFSARQAPPETVLGSDMIQTPVTDDVNRPKAVRPLNFFLSVEKSMSQIINDEIMNWFATIKDFNNLIGEPVERYRAEYRNLEHLRKMFFSKVKSEPDFERFLEFYKWIDSSISMMMTQLLPMSADASSKVRNIVESHLLERNKYENKAPILFKGDDIVSTISTALNYSYEQQKSGTGTLWLKQRAERSGSAYVGTPLEPYNDLDREVIRQIVNSKNLNKSPVLYDVSNNRYYDGKKDQNRIFSQQYRLLTDQMTIVEDSISSPLISNKRFTGSRETAEQLVNSSSNQIVSRFYKRQGNYTQPYEYLQMVGRTANNKSFVDLTGSIITVSSSLSGVVDRTLPTRNTYKNVIVERFSAPGGPEVLSRGALDRAAEEYSSYNDLNSRNIRVRKQLRSWLAESASYDSVNPSIHKVNKNVARRPTDETGNNFVAKYDNDFVTHQIPQSDQGYSWISSSLSTKPRVSGYVGNYQNLNAYNTSSFQFISQSTDTLGRAIDYSGLNTVLAKMIDTGSLTVSTGSDVGINLNSFLANTNGKYGYPTWKQIRKDGNKLVQLARKANKILAQDTPTLKTKIENGYKVQYSERRAQTFTSYKQPPVTFNKPMKHSLFVTGSEDPIDLISTYDNNRERFSNEDLARATGIFDRTDPQAHDVLVALDNGAVDPKPELYKLEYQSQLYPSDKYTGLSDARIRSNYEDWYGNTASVVNTRTFWRDSVDERERVSVTKDLYDYEFESYTSTYPETKNIISYNNDITNFFLLTDTNQTKNSVHGLDSLKQYDDYDSNISSFNGNHNKISYFDGTTWMPLGSGLNGNVLSSISSSDGIFVVGNFTTAGGSPVNRIAVWNGSSWSALGSGLNNIVRTIVSGSDGIYVGGDFITAGGSSANRIAKWNGSSWSALGSGFDNTVYTITSGSDGIYVGGNFTAFVAGSPVNRIAKWNGSSWSALGSGLGGPVYAITSGSNNICVGGDFITAGGVSANRIAVWNGSTWSALGSGFDNTVRTIISASGDIYAGGDFTTAGGSSARNIAKWNGSSWSALGDQLVSAIGYIVYTMTSASDGLYVGGYFIAQNGSRSIAKWNGTSWGYLNNNISFNSDIYSITIANDKILIGGSFSNIITNVNNFISYENDILKSYYVTGDIYSLASSSEGVYIGGSFLSVENTNSNYIARYNGSSWSTLGNGLNSGVNSIVSGSDGIYVGGNFTTAGGSSANRIAKWNGSSWSALGSGLDNTVNSIVSGSDGIYVGGNFTTAGGSSANRIAKWNGSSWSALGSGLNNVVTSIVSSSEGIYAGGWFTTAGGSSANRIAKWNGSSWSALGSGLNTTVYAITSGSDGLYVGGDFITAGGVSANRIAKWNGSSWSALGSGFDNTVRTIVSSSDGLYVGGYSNNGISKWNGATWENVKFNYTYGTINSIVINGNNIYTGGGANLYFGIIRKPNKVFNYTRNINGSLKNTNLIDNFYNIYSNISYNITNIAVYNLKQDNIYNIKNNISVDNYSWNNYPRTILSGSDGIYVGGKFTIAGGVSANRIAKWDGSTWSTLGSGLNLPYVDSLGCLIINSSSDGLYAGGDFSIAGGVSANGIARWNGSSWSALGTGLTLDWYGSIIPGRVRTIVSGNDGLYIGGGFTRANGTLGYNRVAKWNGVTWLSMSSGFTSEVHVIVSGSDGIYAGGDFTTPSGICYSVSKWNGTSWTDLGVGTNYLPGGNNVLCMTSGSDGLYIGGNFTTAGGVTVNRIAKWNGSSWSALGSGLDNEVKTIVSASDGLYVGGSFIVAGGISAFNIAKWNGSSWSYIGRSEKRNGFNKDFTSFVTSLFLDQQKLLIAGYFSGITFGPIIKDKRFDNYVDAYYTNKTVFPKPSLTFNNFIPPSRGALSGMKITEITYDSSNNISSRTEYSSSERIIILNENYQYETDKKSGKTPFFNSYLDYLGNIKSISVSHSLIPEYTISEHIKTYTIERNGDFSSNLNEDYLKLNGGAQEEGYENINSSLNTTNTLKPELVFSNSKNNENINLNLKVSGIKKLLPYRDFYPSERIIKLSNYFINSFLNLDTKLTSVLNADEIYSSSLSNGTPINQQILTLLQPMMAPGILLNTIKSSIAVDWPAIIANSGSYDANSVNFYASTGSNLIQAQVYSFLYDKYYNYTASNYINQEQNFRFPFESIIEFDTQIPQSLKTDDNNLYYLNPTHYTSDAITGSDYGLLSYPSYNMGTGSLKPFVFRDNNYKLAMHNFLAEIPNFFLNGKLTNIVSLPESQFEVAKAGVRYYMDVVLERDSKYKEFIADPYQEGLKKQNNSFSDGTFLTPSPDSLYGPPTRFWTNANPSPFFARSPYNFYSKLLDTPAYAPYVPPYYYGKAIARISFLAEDNRKYSLSEIQNLSTVEYINEEARVLFEKISSFISGNFSAPYGDNYSSSPAYKQMMTVSSSINLFLSADRKLTTQDAKSGETKEVSDREGRDSSWIIQTKFETPSINFINADLSENIGLKFLGGTKESGSVIGAYSYMMKGLWTTYGQPVENGSGIKLYIQPSYQKFNENLTGSLIDLCGFRNVLDQKKTIGLLSERKKVSEGIVVIPYTYNKNHGNNKNDVYAETLPEILGENGIYSASQTGNGPYYYKIDKRIISRYLGGLNFDNSSLEQIKKAAESSEYQGNSIIKLINSMTKYVIPPHLDWLRNKNITPFVMYIADFSTEFDKQDLSDIWQGVMPKQSYKAELDEVSINHKFEVGEMFHSKRPQDDTKFKVFKVKQRANINYYKLTDDSKDDDRFKFTFGNSQQAVVPEYSYNWPYDFFSLVELVNIEASLKVDNYPQTTVARENEERRRILNTAVIDLGPLKREDVKELASMKETAKKDKVKAKEERLSPKTDKRDLPNPLTDPKPKKGKKKRGD